jgi:hypothetical protein
VRPFLAIFLLVLISTSLKAQLVDQHDHEWELGLALNPTYMVSEGEWTKGLHIHAVKSFKESPLGIGLGYERIFDDHSHQTFSVVGAYRLNPSWVVNVAPGFTVEQGDWNVLLPACHFETAYEFLLGEIHVGPALEYAWDPEDQHLSIGLHFGLGF